MPEQSSGRSLSERPPQPRVERPVLEVPDAPPGVLGLSGGDERVSGDPLRQINAAVEGWRRAVAGSGMPDTLLASGPQAAGSWLDLTHAHPSGLAQLFAGRPTRLSSLFRESVAHAAAWRQARSIRASALVLSAQRGVQGCCLAIGVASWRPRVDPAFGPVLAPIVLRGCSVRPRGAGDDDFDLDLEDAVLINPELIRELVESYGIEADGAHLAGLAQGEKGFDPRPVYAWLEERCRSLRAFKIERSLVLATFAAGSGAVLADLDAAVPAIITHKLLSRVATHEGAAGPELLSLDDVEPGTGDLDVTTRGTLEFRPSADLVPATPRPSQPAGAEAALVTEPAQAALSADPTGLPGLTGLPGTTAPTARGERDRGESDPKAGPDLPQSLAPRREGEGERREPGVPESRRLAVVGRLGPRGARPVRPPAEPDPAEELLVLECDPAQQEALAAALRGENVVIEGPPGSGATHTVAAAIAGLVAAGRRVLVLSPRRASTEALLTRLEAAGIGDLVLDLRDSLGGRPAARSSAAAAVLRAGLAAATDGSRGELPSLPRIGRANGNDELVQTITKARELLDGTVDALHEVRQPWGVSAYDAMVALSELNGRSDAPTSAVRLGDDVLNRFDVVTRERLRVHLHSAAGVGVFTLTRNDTRWYDAQVTTAEQAHRALEAALVLRGGVARARSAMDAVALAAGLRPAATAGDWLPLLDLLLSVRAVVDAMLPTVYEHPLAELADAVAPRGLRTDESLGRRDRRRLRKQAQSLVRPGVHVANVYEVLRTAQRQRLMWSEFSVNGEGPRLVVGLPEAKAAVNRVLAALDVLSKTFKGAPEPDPHQDPAVDLGARGSGLDPGRDLDLSRDLDLDLDLDLDRDLDLRAVPLPELERRMADLADDEQGILGQPRRATLIDGLAQAGLADLVADLRRRRVGPEQIDAEYDLVWWSSVRDSVARTDPRFLKHDRQALRRAAADLRTAESARIAAGADLVRTAVLGRAAKVIAGSPDQVRVLRRELAAEDRRPRMVDLLRRCGDVLAALTPIWMMSPDTVAACLPPADPGRPAVIDTVVVDDAGHIGLPEVVAALARGAQVIVAGDRRRLAPPDGSTSVIEALAPFTRVCRLDRDHRARDGRMLVPLAPRYPEGWRLTPGTGTLPPLFLEAVPDGIAIPPPGEELPVSSDAEVHRVVDLVERHALHQPDESLVVVTLSERHAERIEEALRLEVADRPVLGRWLAEQWQDGHPEPFVVRSVQRVLGVERDAAIVSIGLARTPHGRVLHRFGVLDGDKGAAALTTAVSRARGRTTVVCCFTVDDLIVDRLRTAGARLLRDVLLAASGRGTASAGRVSLVTDGLVTDLRDRLAASGLSVQVRVGDGAWPLDIAVADARVPGRMLVAIDLDGPSFASHACRERERNRPARWERAGWTYCKVSAIDLFNDPALEVAQIVEAWQSAMAQPLPTDADAGTQWLTASIPLPAMDTSPDDVFAAAENPPPAAHTTDTTDIVGRARVADRAEAERAEVDRAEVERAEAERQEQVAPAPEAGHQRAEPPVLPTRAKDDLDEGWGEREPDDHDEQLRRDRPPHWD